MKQKFMTSDTHFVNALSGGHNPVGSKNQDLILENIIKCYRKCNERP